MVKYLLRLSEVGGWAMLRIMLKQKTQAITRKTCLLMLFLAMHTNIYDMKASTVALVRVH